MKPLVPGCGEFTARERQTFVWKTAHNPRGERFLREMKQVGGCPHEEHSSKAGKAAKSRPCATPSCSRLSVGLNHPRGPGVTISLRPFQSHGSPCHLPHALVRRASGQGLPQPTTPLRESSLGARGPCTASRSHPHSDGILCGRSAQGHRPLASNRNKWSALLGKGNHDFLRGQPRNPRFPRGAFRARHGTWACSHGAPGLGVWGPGLLVPMWAIFFLSQASVSVLQIRG